MLQRIRTLITHKISNLPIIVLMPHSSCNCRCIMCDIWKANHNKQEISLTLLENHVDAFRKLQVREIVFSGGEALMHSNLWSLCRLLKAEGIKLTLLSTGLLLQRYAKEIVQYLDQVIISIDGSSEVHDRIRNIPNGFEKLAKGIGEIRDGDKTFPIHARCVLQRHNFRDFVNTVKAAKAIGVDQISFLAADVSTPAFNHESLLGQDRVSEISLTPDEAEELDKILDGSFVELKEEYKSGFIAESPVKIKRLVQYYLALNGRGDFPGTVCNAPWVSAVIESNGDVMPCFFHKPYGNIYKASFQDILNTETAISFRKNLDVATNAICKKCVCSLKVGLMQMN